MPVASNSRKILLVTNDLGPRSGGIETFILGLIAKLDGQQLVIYTSKQSGDAQFDSLLRTKYQVEIYRDKTKILLPLPSVIREVKRVMAKHNSETIWFGAAAPLALMAPSLRRAGAKRIVALTHGHEVWWAKVPLFKQALGRIARSVDVLTYLGGFTKEAIAPVVPDSTSLIQIAPGISTEFFKPIAKSRELIAKYEIGIRPTIVSVGRLVHRKGQDKLIEAMPQIKAAIPGALLLIIGSGPREAHLRKLITKLKLDKDVKLLGRVTVDQLPAHISLGNIFAMPARSRLFGLEVEGLGIVYLEASSCGIPVIAGDSGGAPDAVVVNETGLVVNGKSVEEIAQACIKLLANPDLAKALGSNGRNWAIANWDWNIWGEKFVQVLKG